MINKVLKLKSKTLLVGYLVLVVFVLVLALCAWYLGDAPTLYAALGTLVFSLYLAFLVEML